MGGGDLWTHINLQVVLKFRNQLIEGLKKYHKAFCPFLSSVSLYIGCSVLKMSLLPVMVPSGSGLITIFTSCNLLPKRAQHCPRAEPQWSGRAHMPSLDLSLVWTMVQIEWLQWVLCTPRVSMDWEWRRMVSQENRGAIVKGKRRDVGQVNTTVYSILQI